MQTLRKPGWFTNAVRNLELIKENLKDFDNEERIPPNGEVIDAAGSFLEALNESFESELAEPELFVSPNGEIVITLGAGKKTLNVRFAPELSFTFRDASGSTKGKGADRALELAKHFQVL